MSLDRLFNANSVAIIGASRNEKKRGFQAIKTLLEDKFEGDIFPVHPHEESILGLRCYKNILSIEKQVDIALITTPASTVPSILEDCGRKGVGGVVIVAGGFGEVDDDGKRAENMIADIARRYHIRVIGPNTSGMINVGKNLNLVGLRNVPKGDIALLVQSGNIALHLITEATLKSHKGFSYYVGVGNESDIKFHEYLEYFTNDPSTRVILIYVEGLRDGRRFLQQAYKTTPQKPIVLLKSGRTYSGKKSAGSHTGALAGISEVARVSFARAGIINIENSDELFPAAETLTCQPPLSNNKVAILADGGGHATIAADLLSDSNIEVPELSKKTKSLLREVLPFNASVVNPIDVAGGTDADPTIFADCARILLSDRNIGGLLIVGLFGGYGIRFEEKLRFMEEDAAHQMGKLVKMYNKPIVLHSLYNSAKPHSLELMRYYNIPVYESLDIACKCMSVLSEYGHFLRTYHKKTSFVFNYGVKANEQGKTLFARARTENRNVLLEPEAKQLLKLHGAPVTVDRLAKTAQEAVKLAAELGYDVALKVVSPNILHKSDAKAVKLGLRSADEVKHAFDEIIRNSLEYNPGAQIAGCIVSSMACHGVEVIIGTKIDEQFGPVIMFGIGGILVEVVKDVSFRVLPISRFSAKGMISEIKSSPILNGVRGRLPVDKDALTDLLLTVSEIVEAYPQIEEMDLNPVIVHNQGLTIVDARIILKKESET